MKKSVRALRMERQQKRMSQTSKLSLVSLMDIFTILVFFLMMNTSEVQVLQTHKSVKLPESHADTSAQETLLLMVNEKDIILQGQKLADVATVLASGEEIIAALDSELQYQANRTLALASDTSGDSAERAITIMGDRSIPYELLKKLMQTCANAGYSNISLAVEQLQPPSVESVAEAG
ncbi:biopolymer transporter ExbD [Alteromonadaceae bacterium BrNp21-10]|nr:biopolymer transporter ExbD [Alteromonadaceae bacterium BrNp21-10]